MPPFLACLTVLFFFLNHRCYAQLHFASLGNWGHGSATQRIVADTLKATARKEKVSFVVSPGSNFVSGMGVSDLSDSVWTTQFTDSYKGPELHLPFFTVLGAEDWKGNFTAFVHKSQADYAAVANVTALGPRWTLPNWWYHFTQHFQDASGNNTMVTATDVSAGFIFVDTFILSDAFAYPNITKKHWDTLKDTVQAAVQIFDWTIVIGDAAMLSSGASKGNARLFRSFGAFLKDYGVDAYISGNDYDMEILKDGNMTHINCGSGSRADSLYRRPVSESVHYVAKPGFCHHVLSKQQFRTEFIDGKTGNVLYTYTQPRNDRSRSRFSRFRLYQGLPEITFIPIPPFGKATRPREGDYGILIMGTIGLVILAYVILIHIATVITRLQKYRE